MRIIIELGMFQIALQAITQHCLKRSGGTYLLQLKIYIKTYKITISCPTNLSESITLVSKIMIKNFIDF